MHSIPQQDVSRIEEREGVCLSLVRRVKKDIGSIILSPDSFYLISGVEIELGTIYPDDRGFFAELFRLGATPMTESVKLSETLQVSAAMAYPGIIKAVHYHFEQTDFWAPVQGMFQVMLCDLREGPPTHGTVNTMYVGTLRPWRLKIPPGVGHGYKVLGREPAVLVYMTDRFYNPRDEGRLAYDHAFLNYDWELQHK